MNLESIELMLARTENLPVLPKIVQTILGLVDKQDIPSEKIEAVIATDAAISAKLLKVAGSSYYGGVPAKTLTRALAFLGLTTVKNLVIGIAYQQVIGVRSATPNFDRQEFWKHSLATATASKVLARVKSLSYSEELYFAGMVHDIGLLVFDRFNPSEFEVILKICDEQKVDLPTAESLAGFASHAAAGGLLAKRWHLSPIQQSAVAFHHQPENAERTFFTPTLIVALADRLAHECGFTNQSKTAPVKPVPEEWLKALELPEEQLDAVRQVVKIEVEKISGSLMAA